MKAERRKLFHAFAVLALCLAVIAGSGVAGYLYLAAEQQSVDTEARSQLAAIADMKVRQLSAWRSERLADAKALQTNPFVIPGVIESLASGRNRGEIEAWLGQLMEAYQYAAAGLWDRAYRRRIWWPASEPSHDVERDLVMEAMHARIPLLVDLHRDESTGTAHMALVVPLLSRSSPEPIGALLLEVDPESFLYPALQTWPTPSRSAETLLVRREGDEVVFLNPLRHRKDTALSLRFPLERGGLPAAKAVLGFEGVMEGVDYRGTAVLAASRRVPDSPWYLVAKVDTEEVLAPLRRRTSFIVAFFGLVAVVLIAGIMILWSRQETRAHRQQHEAELERRAILGHFGYLSRYANDIILLLDATGRIVEANDRAVDSYGHSQDELRRMNIADLHAPERGDTLARIWAEVKDKGPEGSVFEAEHLRKDGRRFPVEVSARVIEVEGREFRQEIIRDITERKRAEEALRKSEARLSFALQTIDTGTWELDLRDHTAQRTLIHDRIFGYETLLPSWTLETFLEHVLPEDRPEVERRFHEATAAQTDWVFECRIRRTDNEVRWIFAAGRHERTSEGAPARISGVVQDITERKRAEEAVRQLNAELEQRVRDRTAQLELANRELESFSYSVSHDLRGPLRGIDGWSLALLEEYRDKLDAQACEYLDFIRSDTQRMGQLIDDMLKLAQVSRGRMERALVDLEAISRAVAARFQQKQPNRRVEFTVQPGLTAWGDAGLLEIALANLIDNAWKFSSRRPLARIEFGRTEADGHAVFFIRDNGVGFDMAYVHKLFGAFQRLHKASEFPGTGIGLAIVQRVVHRHNGRVWAEAEPDAGATFYFTLQEPV